MILAEAFSSESLRPDLLRCPSFPEPSHEYRHHRYHFLIQELARTIRLHMVRCRWVFTENVDWVQEVIQLSNAISNPANELQPRAPILECLVLFQNAFDSKDQMGWSGRTQVLFDVKDEIDNHVIHFVESKLEGIKEELDGLNLLKKRFDFQSSLGVILRTAKDDSRNRGSLLLNTVPEFSDQFVVKQSPSWSLTDQLEQSAARCDGPRTDRIESGCRHATIGIRFRD